MLKSTKIPTECKVCSAPAFNSYYGAKSCEPCKVFFKRNASRPMKILKCDFNGQCQINIYNRHICSACRLKKCLDVGMSPEMIRAPQGKRKQNVKTSSALMQVTRHKYIQSQQLTTLNLLERDQSLLSSDQWILLSNLIHSYDERQFLPIAKNFLKELDSLHPKLRFKIDSKDILNIVTNFYHVAEIFIQSNHDLALLSFDNRSIVLRGIIDSISCLGGGLLLRESGLMTSLPFRQGLENTYGIIPYNLTLTTISLLDQDVNLVKLTLALFAFCTSNCTLFEEKTPWIYVANSRAFLRIQNTYAELIWKYLLYKYTFDQAVIRFSHLVKSLIIVYTTRTYLQTVRNHTDVVDSFIQKIEQKQMDINDY